MISDGYYIASRSEKAISLNIRVLFSSYLEGIDYSPLTYNYILSTVTDFA